MHKLRRVALVSALLLATVALFEAAVRVLDPLGVSHFRDMQRYLVEFCEHPGPPRILRHRPNDSMDFRGFVIRTNALGLRGADLDEPKPKYEYRVLMLGDSVVLGWGAREEDLFVTLAERELNGLATPGRAYRIVNAGHNQYDTAQEAATLHELGPRIDPDAVLLVYVVNDVEPTIRVWNAYQQQARAAADDPPGAFARFWGWLRSEPLHGISGVFEFLKHARAGQSANAPAAPDPEGWQSSRNALLQIRDWCKARGTPFLVLDHTHPGTDGHGPEIPGLVAFLQEAGIPRVPFHFTIEERARPIRRSAADAHANALGHRLLLEKLRPALRALDLRTR